MRLGRFSWHGNSIIFCLSVRLPWLLPFFQSTFYQARLTVELRFCDARAISETPRLLTILTNRQSPSSAPIPYIPRRISIAETYKTVCCTNSSCPGPSDLNHQVYTYLVCCTSNLITTWTPRVGEHERFPRHLVSRKNEASTQLEVRTVGESTFTAQRELHFIVSPTPHPCGASEL